MYKRRFRGRRPRRFKRSKRGFGSTAMSVAKTAGKALSLARYIKTLINVEHKWVDVVSTGNQMSNTMTITPLNIVQQGVTANTRNGDKIKASNLSIHAYLQQNITATVPSLQRIFVLKDDNSNGVAPTAAQILENVSSGEYTCLSHYNNDNVPSRFTILHDFSFALGLVTGDNSARALKVDIPLDHHMTYLGNAGTQADLGAGALYICYVTNPGVSNSYFDYRIRLAFVDN